jgi:PqqD family protein of HPr-rel-A system
MHSTSWQCRRQDELEIRRFTDGAVVFDDATGDLHALTPVASEVLSLLFANQSSWTTTELVDSLFGSSSLPEDCEQLESLLQHFRSIGLIERTQV